MGTSSGGSREFIPFREGGGRGRENAGKELEEKRYLVFTPQLLPVHLHHNPSSEDDSRNHTESPIVALGSRNGGK